MTALMISSPRPGVRLGSSWLPVCMYRKCTSAIHVSKRRRQCFSFACCGTNRFALLRQQRAPIIVERHNLAQNTLPKFVGGKTSRVDIDLSNLKQIISTMNYTMLYYNFQKLESGQQIRLLHLQPSEFHEPVSATMSLAYLEDHPKYEALSYVWGHPKICLDITLDGQTVSVTINLWTALQRRTSS